MHHQFSIIIMPYARIFMAFAGHACHQRALAVRKRVQKLHCSCPVTSHILLKYHFILAVSVFSFILFVSAERAKAFQTYRTSHSLFQSHKLTIPSILGDPSLFTIIRNISTQSRPWNKTCRERSSDILHIFMIQRDISWSCVAGRAKTDIEPAKIQPTLHMSMASA